MLLRRILLFEWVRSSADASGNYSSTRRSGAASGSCQRHPNRSLRRQPQRIRDLAQDDT